MLIRFDMADSSGIGGLFTALGLNVQALILNTIAFLIIIYIMARFIAPTLVKALDAKRDELDAATRLKAEATHDLDEAKAAAAKVLSDARAAADGIVDNAKAEASDALKATTAKAEAEAKRIGDEAATSLRRDVELARKALKADTARLVAAATETILDEKLDATKDAALMNRSLEAKS